MTSDKARLRRGLAPRLEPDGSRPRFDALRPQRLAAAARVYVEQFSAHPLEVDRAELYGPPDGYIAPDGTFRHDRQSLDDKAVYAIDLHPDDGLYPLPYMALQADGSPWEEECASPGAPEIAARQGFFPDGSRSFEEIDRLSVGADGLANAVASLADVDFYRAAPPGGYTKGLAADRRTDAGAGAIAPETRGRNYFPYKPRHLGAAPPRPMLAHITNVVQAVAASGDYDGIIWTQGSPQVEETAYWLNLLVDTAVPICATASQRPHGQLGNDGPPNIVDCLRFIGSGTWKDDPGRNRCGTVVLQEQQIFAAREVAKVDARPGGYVATGGHGGILGQVTHAGACVIQYVPAYKHTYLSDVNVTHLPRTTRATFKDADGPIDLIEVKIKDGRGTLRMDAVPVVSIIKDGTYSTLDFGDDPELELDLKASVAHKLSMRRLAGFVVEGLVPYGHNASTSRHALLLAATFSGLPVCRVGRGAPEGFADPHPYQIAASNLTATKARLLLMACLMKFGSLPAARDPAQPTSLECEAVRRGVAAYQSIFDSH